MERSGVGGLRALLRGWQIWGAGRQAHTAAGSTGRQLLGLQAQYLPFQVTSEEAEERYRRWQRSRWLTPGNLLSREGAHSLTPVMLPYWLFSIQARVQYTGEVGIKAAQGSGAAETWREVGWAAIEAADFPPQRPELQVHAGFEHRRDFADAMKRGVRFEGLRPVTRAEAEAQELRFPAVVEGGVALRPPQMRKAIGWEFALRGAHKIAAEDAERLLKEQDGADSVRNVSVVLAPVARQAALVYLPAYSLTYLHGEEHNAHGERQPRRFHGLISGLKDGGVAGERHVSVVKASTVGGSVTLGAMGVLAVLSPLVGADPFLWSSFDFVFSALSVGATAGLVAQLAPGFLADHADRRRFAAEGELEAAVAASAGRPPPGSEDRVMDLEEMHRTNLEWMRWEESDLRAWDAEKRGRWAHQLWTAQHSRRRERRRRREEARREHARRESEEVRERRRRSRWGPRSTPFSQEFLANKGRPDFKGYYKALGLDPSGERVSQDDVKRAFREAAKKWHPDRHPDASGKRRARERFHEVRTAYETLRDPERRRHYDLGQTPPPQQQ